MAFIFTYPDERGASRKTVPLEIDLQRFFAVNRNSCHFIAPADPCYSKVFTHYDRLYTEGASVPAAVIDIDRDTVASDPEYLGVIDGRKRLAWLAQKGEKTVPVLVPEDNYAIIKKLIGARQPRYEINDGTMVANPFSSARTVS